MKQFLWTSANQEWFQGSEMINYLNNIILLSVFNKSSHYCSPLSWVDPTGVELDVAVYEIEKYIHMD